MQVFNLMNLSSTVIVPASIASISWLVAITTVSRRIANVNEYFLIVNI